MVDVWGIEVWILHDLPCVLAERDTPGDPRFGFVLVNGQDRIVGEQREELFTAYVCEFSGFDPQYDQEISP